MKVRDVINQLGGGTEAAKKLETTPQAISNWITRGSIPSAYATAIVRKTSGDEVPIKYEDIL